jgi:hypothetical protein
MYCSVEPLAILLLWVAYVTITEVIAEVATEVLAEVITEIAIEIATEVLVELTASRLEYYLQI